MYWLMDNTVVARLASCPPKPPLCFLFHCVLPTLAVKKNGKSEINYHSVWVIVACASCRASMRAAAATCCHHASSVVFFI